MATEIGPPKTRVGKLYNELVHKFRVVQWWDEWWYERARIPCEIGSFACEGLTYAVGFGLGLPAVLVVPLARSLAHLDEAHAFFLAIRHKNFSLFDEAQTWKRARDGSIVRGEIPESEGADHRWNRSDLSLWERTQRFCSDFWTERRRWPGFVAGMASPVLAFAAGTIFGAPVAVVGIIAYATFGIQMLPVVRNAALSVMHWDSSYLNRPQTIARKPREAVDADGPAVVTVADPTMVEILVPAEPAAPQGPAHIEQMPPSTRRVAGHVQSRTIASRERAVAAVATRPPMALDL